MPRTPEQEAMSAVASSVEFVGLVRKPAQRRTYGQVRNRNSYGSCMVALGRAIQRVLPVWYVQAAISSPCATQSMYPAVDVDGNLAKGETQGSHSAAPKASRRREGPAHVEGTWARRAWPDARLHNGPCASMEGGHGRVAAARKAGEQLVVHAIMSASVGVAAGGERPRAARTSSAGVVAHGRQWQRDAG
jgi:hypothetical protein